MFAQRQTLLPRQVQKIGERPQIAMHVVVGIEMGSRAAEQLFEPSQLRVQSSAEPTRIGVCAQFASDIGVQAHAQTRRAAAQLRCLPAGRRVHQQARARQDAALVRFDDAAIDPAARAKVIGVDDQIFHDDTSLAATRFQTPRATFRASISRLVQAFLRGSARWRRSSRANAT